MLKSKLLSKYPEIEYKFTGQGEEQFFQTPNLILADQIHQNRTQRVNLKTKSPVAGTDALISSEQGLWLGIQTADCVPILLYDYKKRIIAAVHAGWRGTAYKIVTETLDQMKSFPDSVIAVLGPAICQRCFQVGLEVAKYFPEEVKERVGEGKWRVDLWQANKLQLMERDIPERQIELIDVCTYENPNSLYSFRRGDRAKRNGAFIKLK